MARTAGSRTSTPSLPALEKRSDTLLARVRARAQKVADDNLQAAEYWDRASIYQRDLTWVTAELRDLGSVPEVLTAEGRQRVRELRAYKAQLEREHDDYRETYLTTARQALNRLDRFDKAMKRAHRLDPGPGRLRTLLSSLDELDAYLWQSDRTTRTAVESGLEVLEAQALAEAAEAARRQTSEQAELDAVLSVVTLPPPLEWEFDGLPEELLPKDVQVPAAGVEEYRLNRMAQELSLARGFDVLLTPQLTHGLTEYPHQIETARVVLRRMRGRALLCDEVGLGKTIEAGIVTREYVARGLVRRVLILAPPALVGQWRQEMAEKFGLEFTTHEDPEFRQMGPDAWGRFDRILASSHTARMAVHREALEKQEFDLIIVDEAHHLRNRTSQGWKLVNSLKKKYVLLLTATPVQNNLDELFNLITLLSPGQLKTSAAFRKEFVTRGDPRTPANRERLRQLLAEVMVRNTRSQVTLILPPRTATTHRIEPSTGEVELLRHVTQYLRERWQAGQVDRLAASTLLRQAGSSMAALAGGLERFTERRAADRKLLSGWAASARELSTAGTEAKARQLCQLLARRQVKTLVFTQFRDTLHVLEEALRRAKISFTTLSGELDAAGKARAVAEFAADRRVLLSTDVGSEGKNLQFCHAIVNYDLPWNPMRIEQRVGRVHRIGQREEVLIDNFCSRHTIEDHILRVLDAKLNMFELVVGEIGIILGNLETEQDFDELALGIWVGAGGDAEVEQGFDALAEQLQEAQSRYRSAQALDEALFGNELATPLQAETTHG